MPDTSIRVVTRGPHNIVGSSPSLVARKGKQVPKILDNVMMHIIVKQTIRPIEESVINVAIPNVQIARRIAKKIPTRTSFQRTFIKSANEISFVASAVISRVADCEPVLPPISMRSGKK